MHNFDEPILILDPTFTNLLLIHSTVSSGSYSLYIFVFIFFPVFLCLHAILYLMSVNRAADLYLVFRSADWGPAGPFLVQTPQSPSQNEAKRRPHHQAAVGGRPGETAPPRKAAVTFSKVVLV